MLQKVKDKITGKGARVYVTLNSARDLVAVDRGGAFRVSGRVLH